MLFRRRTCTAGPYLGEYYETMARPIVYGPVVAWRGKKLVSRPSVSHETWPFVFADGSWADPVTGEYYDAPGRGKLLVVTGAEANPASRALGGLKRIP